MIAFLLVWVLLGGLSSLPAAEKKSKNPREEAETALEKLLENRVFETRIVVANCHITSQGGQWNRYAVDTEVRPDFSVKQNVRFLVWSPGKAGRRCLGRRAREGTTFELPPGTRMTVTDVDIEDDRLDVALRGPNDEYGRLKLFFGDWVTGSSPTPLHLYYLAATLRVAPYDRLHDLQKEYVLLVLEWLSEKQPTLGPGEARNWMKGINVGLRSGEKNIEQVFRSSAANPRDEMNRTRQVLSKLERILRNQRDYQAALRAAQLEGQLEAPEFEYWQKATEILQARLGELEKQALEQRKMELRSQWARRKADYDSAQATLAGAAPKTLADLDRQTAQLQRCLDLLQRRRDLLNQLEQLGDTSDPADRDEISREEQRLLALRQQWETERAKLEAAKLNEDYIQLRLRLNPLEQRYQAARGRGDSEQYALRNELRALLESLLTNRQQAAALGDPRAPHQLDEIRKKRDAVR